MSELNPSNELQTLSIEARAARRQALLDEFAEHPNDESVWQTAYQWARAEGDHLDQSGIAADVPADELIALADIARQTPQNQRYDLMSDFSSSGRRWFDILETFGSEQLAQAKEAIISAWVNQKAPPTKYQRALDLGTGTGKSLKILEGNADEVVGLDRNPKLLAIASEIAAEDTTLVQGEVDRIPFDDNSFDLVASSGLTGSLDRATLSRFYTELARILSPDGIYVELSPWPFDGYVGEQQARITASSKGMLADMIVDTVSGKSQISDYLGIEEQADLFEEFGLGIAYYDEPSEDGITHNFLTVITKL